MKYKKIILLLLLVAALVIILFPPEKKLNLDGDWSIDKIIVNGEDKRISGLFIISNNNLTIRGSNFVEQGIEHADFIIKKDSVKIKSIDETRILPVEEINYNGNYKINISSTLEGSGNTAAFNYKLVLESEDVSINLSRIDRVKWYNGVKRGRP